MSLTLNLLLLRTQELTLHGAVSQFSGPARLGHSWAAALLVPLLPLLPGDEQDRMQSCSHNPTCFISLFEHQYAGARAHILGASAKLFILEVQSYNLQTSSTSTKLQLTNI